VSGSALKKHIKRRRTLRPGAAVLAALALIAAILVGKLVAGLLIALFGVGIAGLLLLSAGRGCPVCNSELEIGDGKVSCPRCHITAELPA